MNRQKILLSLLVVAGAVAGPYMYMQWSDRARERARMAEWARAVELKKQQQQEARAREPKLIAEAGVLLDSWPRQADALPKAARILEQVLQVNPNSVPARIQMARLHMKAGYISSRNFQPGSLDRADQELRRALQADPRSADAYVLQGHLFYLSYDSEKALKSLEKAEAIGTDNPFLRLNWADALIDLKRWDEAQAQLRKLLAKYGEMEAVPAGIRGAVHSTLAEIYKNQGKLDEADKQYWAALALSPGDAWGHGNYAYFLLFSRGMPDAAIAEAEKALSIMNYGIGRLTLAAALYAKWAQEKDRAPKEAAEYFARAKAGTPDYTWIMSQAARFVSTGPAIQGMVKELMKLGVSLDIQDNYGDTGLNLAAYDGNLQSVLLLMKYGANLELAHMSGQTAVAQAATQGYPEVVKALVARGAKVNSRDSEGRTPLYSAAHKGNKEMVNTLISLKADLNIGTTRGYTPLMHAAFRGDEDMVRLLLKLGADPSLVTKDDQTTAAQFAASQKHEALAALIREAAAKSSARRQ